MTRPIEASPSNTRQTTFEDTLQKLRLVSTKIHNLQLREIRPIIGPLQADQLSSEIDPISRQWIALTDNLLHTTSSTPEVAIRRVQTLYETQVPLTGPSWSETRYYIAHLNDRTFNSLEMAALRKQEYSLQSTLRTYRGRSV